MTFPSQWKDYIRPSIQRLIDRGAITLAEYKDLRANSYEFEAMMPALDEEAFLYALQHCLSNCRQPTKRPYATYDEALVGRYVPELMQRFQALQRERSDEQIQFEIKRSQAVRTETTGISYRDATESNEQIQPSLNPDRRWFPERPQRGDTISLKSNIRAVGVVIATMYETCEGLHVKFPAGQTYIPSYRDVSIVSRHLDP